MKKFEDAFCNRSKWVIEIPEKMGHARTLIFSGLKIDSLTLYHFRSMAFLHTAVGLRTQYVKITSRNTAKIYQKFEPENG